MPPIRAPCDGPYPHAPPSRGRSITDRDVVDLVTHLLHAPQDWWPGDERFDRRNRDKATAAAAALGRTEAAIREGVRELADGDVVHVVSRGGAGSHLVGEILADAFDGINAHEVYPPVLRGAAAAEQRDFDHLALRAHAAAFASNPVGDRVVVVTSHEGSTLALPTDDPRHRLLHLLRDPFDVAVSRALRKDGYRAEMSPESSDDAWLVTQARHAAAWADIAYDLDGPKLRYEDLKEGRPEKLAAVLAALGAPDPSIAATLLARHVGARRSGPAGENAAPRRELSGGQIAQLTVELGRARRRLGYPDGPQRARRTCPGTVTGSVAPLPWAPDRDRPPTAGGSPLTVTGDTVTLHLVNSLPSLHLRDADILPQLDGVNVTLQLALLSFRWLGWVDWKDGTTAKAALNLVTRLIDEIDASPRGGDWDMAWDDHGLSDRASMLWRLESAGLIETTQIEGHLQTLEDELEHLLTLGRWQRNNHRVFHLMSLLELLLRRGASERRIHEVSRQLLWTCAELVDIDTGIPVEQALGYADVDCTLLEGIYPTLANLELVDEVPPSFRESTRASLAALAWPDGELPASGDTLLGSELHPTLLPTTKGAGEPGHRDHNRLVSLDRLGYHRLVSRRGGTHAQVLRHAAEAPHGHMSPLHVDAWFRGAGLVLCGPGGPGEYGSEVRSEFLQRARGHTTFEITTRPVSLADAVEVEVDDQRDNCVGWWHLGDTTLRRRLALREDRLILDDEITRGGEWWSSFHFAPGWEVVEAPTSFGLELRVRLRRDPGEVVLHLRRLVGMPVGLEISRTPRCVGRAELVEGVSIVLNGRSNARLRTELIRVTPSDLAAPTTSAVSDELAGSASG